ncbi:MAG: MraY family glycosyltransferase [Planctomycetota bacterium]|jgi:UDP-GlcNAc:undecaprenyl-phosphate GlcNAc-1-phosphate transferase
MIVAALLAAAVALVLSAALTPVTCAVARRTGMLDHPVGRKNHAAATPVLGGSAIFLAISLPAAAALIAARLFADAPPAWLAPEIAIHLPGVASRTPMALTILIGALVLHGVGLIDDRRPLPAALKFAAQVIVAAGVVVIADVRVLTVAGPSVSIVASVLWLVVIINAFNFLDSINGLSASVGIVCGAALLAAATQMEQWFVAGWLCVVVGALLGFLPFNFPRAKTFMGDGGSMVVGYFLAVLSCLTTYVPPGESLDIGRMLTPLVLMAVPLYDMASVIALRLRSGLSVFVGDQRHFSHRLLERGMAPTATVLTIVLCTAGTAIAAALLPRVDGVAALLVAAQTVLILLIMAMMEWGPRAKIPAGAESSDASD